VIIPNLVHGKIITREQLMLRILTIVFIQCIRTDLIDYYSNLQPSLNSTMNLVGAVPIPPNSTPNTNNSTQQNIDFSKLRSFKQNSNNPGDTLRTRDIPHLMTFFNNIADNDKVIKDLSFASDKLENELTYYNESGEFCYLDVEERIKSKIGAFLNSPYTDKKFGTFGTSIGKYKVYMINTLGIANLIYNRNSKMANFTFKKYSQEALKCYMEQYMKSLPPEIIKPDEIIKIINELIACLLKTELITILLVCSDLIYLQNYAKLSSPKCNIPIMILYNLITVFVDSYNSIGLGKSPNANRGGDPLKEAFDGVEMLSDKPQSPEKMRDRIRIIKNSTLVKKIINTWNSTWKFGFGFWTKQVFLKTYYVEQQNIYSGMKLFGATRIINDNNTVSTVSIEEPDKDKVVIQMEAFDNWLEPKNSLGIGEQESDLQSIENLDEKRKFVNVLHTVISRVCARYLTEFNTIPYNIIFSVLKKYQNNNVRD
jgi:hypothetical protein